MSLPYRALGGAVDAPLVSSGPLAARSAGTVDRIGADGKYLAYRGQRYRIQGVTYGPFSPDSDGEPFPPRRTALDDIQRMKHLGVNAIRTYHPPPEWLLELADEEQIGVLIDVPWRKHTSFLESPVAMREARSHVKDAARRASVHPSVIACSVGNEIPSDIVRWYGAKAVETFLGELVDVAKQAAPALLTTYSNYPSTEYLELSSVDFVTFNVYLHEPRVFQRYLLRLQNLVGERPLVLGEIGMDTIRYGEDEQAAFLRGHLADAFLAGLAGAFVFSWTDDWHTGGFPIEDWAFGVTYRDRSPKPSCSVLSEVFQKAPWQLLRETPRVSVLICSYNGAATLRQCLSSLQALNYPDYEVILVDDGSTDNTPEIAALFAEVRYIRQDNLGLSAARNTALMAATGSIVAYTDSDCFADEDWLTLLVQRLEETGADGVGGPNLTPDDGWLAACVAAAPGQPGHVLINDQVAEHIPGCNMAYRRESLLAVNGFQDLYRKAGDDVDLCWRLQQSDRWITFAPGAFVWHHRRQTPRAYLRQQAGYGEAEGLLWFDHPERFNSLGGSKWNGTLYGASSQAVRLGSPVIYHGVFGSGLFQTLYRPATRYWTVIPGSLEWQAAALVAAASAALWLPMLGIAMTMLLLTLVVAIAQAAQAPLPRRYDGLKSKAFVAVLCYLQPVVRSWARYQVRFLPPHARRLHPASPPGSSSCVPIPRTCIVDYWDEKWQDRSDLIRNLERQLEQRNWTLKIDSGWEQWDLQVFGHPWTCVEICTTQEDHGSGKRLIRVRYGLRATERLGAGMVAGTVALMAAWIVSPLSFAIICILALCLLGQCWRRGGRLAQQVIAVGHESAAALGLVRTGEPSEQMESPDADLSEE